MTIWTCAKLFALIVAAGIGWKLRDVAADAQIAGMEKSIAQANEAAMKHAVDLSEANRIKEHSLMLAGADIDRLTAEAQKKNEVQIKTVVKEVIRYAENPDRVAVTLPAEWVLIHNYAATGRKAGPDTAPTGEPDAGPRNAAGNP